MATQRSPDTLSRRIRKAVIKLWAALAIALTAAFTTASASTPETDWTLMDMPPQQEHIFLITGGTAGIGYESAKALAAAGAQVVIAARNPEKGREVIAAIKQNAPHARVQFETLDLADLASVRALAQRLNATLPHLDVLINNAGIMEPPERGTSADGFEMQFAVNYLGHFVLTAELLPLLKKAESPRVVTLSSIAARGGSIHFSDLQFAQNYDPGAAYSQSKLACLMFALELQRRSDAAHWGIQSIAAHPGVSRTDLLIHRTGITGMVRRNLSFLFQPAAQGALPILFAATSPEAHGGGYYGPDRLSETRGYPSVAKVPPQALQEGGAARLWAESERLAGMTYPSAQSVEENPARSVAQTKMTGAD